VTEQQSAACEPGTTVAEFDHFDPALTEDPHAVYQRLRTCPRPYSDRHGGFWVFTRHEDVYGAVRDPKLFSSFPNGVPSSSRTSRHIPLELDPPDHAKYRLLLAPMFSPRATATMADSVRRTASTLIAAFADQGSCELVAQFSRPLPTQVFAEMMGLPVGDAHLFEEWIELIIRPPLENAAAIREQASRAVYDYLARLLAERAGQPARDDLIGVLLRSQVDGRGLNQHEMLEMCWLLFEAGLDTVQAAIGHAVLLLAADAELQDRLRRNPEDVPAAIEEFLRYESHVSMGRTVTTETDFHGYRLRRGDRVLVVPAGADRDEGYFESPDRVDVDRADKRHLAFGAGPHRCLGSHLARLEMRIALEQLHAHLGPYRLDPDRPVVRARPGFVRSFTSLPLRFEVRK
jgi:hypothetical protein